MMEADFEHQLIDYNYIADGIYVGTNMCCQVHFDERLGQEGIVADVSLEGERIDAAQGVQFYLWLPVENNTAPTPEQLEVGVSTLETLVRLKQKVYLHCKNGHGRAPTMMAAYLIAQGKSVDEAVQFVHERRTSVHLQPVQVEALASFARAHDGDTSPDSSTDS